MKKSKTERKRKNTGRLAALGLAAALLAGCGGQTATVPSAAPAPAAETAAPAETEAVTPEIEPETELPPEDSAVPEDVAAPLEGDGEEEEENYDTGDASLDNPRNQDAIGETELLVVSFGTSFNDSRRLTIGAIEDAMEEAFPGLSVRRGFTSQIVIDHVARRDGVRIDNVTEALDRAVANGVKRLAVQPTHLMDGYEYNDLASELARRAGDFEAVTLGRPILDTEADFLRLAEAVRTATADYDDGETAIVFMGHGTEADSNRVYARLQELMDGLGMDNYYIGTVEAAPTVEDVLEAVQSGDYRRVVLEPLMIVAGDHANNDMAGEDPDSWKSIFESAGYETVCLLRGLGELEAIRALLSEHAAAAVNALDYVVSAPVSPAPTPAAIPAGDSATEPRPVRAADLADGVYPVEMLSSSSMFKADHVELKVAGETMEAVLYMSSDAYRWLYPGSAEEAAAAAEADYIPLEENEGELHSFTIPVEVLNTDIPCAAYSVNREQWYDRTLVFFSASLPAEAITADWTEAEDSMEAGSEDAAEAGIPADGVWTVEAILSGGTGKAGIVSPLRLTVAEGQITAELTWTSPNYDYMVVDGEKLLNEAEPGENSRFTVPVKSLDEPLRFIADTTAMSRPHEIEYTLTFDPGTAAPAE